MRHLLICLSLFLTTTCFGNVNVKPLPGMQFVNRTHRLGRGLVGFWPGNERSGNTVQDLSGNGNDLTITGAVTWGGGKFGPALDFAGGYLINSAAKNMPTTKGSAVFWVNLDAAQGQDCFFELSDNSANNRIVFYQGAAHFYLYVIGGGAGGANVYDKEPYSQPAGVWTQLAVTWDTVADSYIVYSNAVSLTGSLVGGTNPTGITNINIGIFYDEATYPLDGVLDNLAFYNHVLTASEIVELYAKPFCMMQGGLPVSMMYAEAPAPAGGQVIIIASMFPLCVIFSITLALVFSRRRRFYGK